MIAHCRPHLRRRSMLRIQQLDMFLHLAESRSISAAAERMRMSQSAVTKSLKEMETYFEAVLFERTARGLVMTEFGRVLERYAESAVSGYEAVHAELRTTQHFERPRDRLGCTHGAGDRLLVDLVGWLRQESIEREIIVQVDAAPALLGGLRSGSLDYAVMHPTDGLDDRLVAYVPLGVESYVVVVRPTHPLASMRVDCEQLLAYAWALPPAESAGCGVLRDALATVGLALPVEAIYVSDPAIVLELALTLELLAFVPRALAAPLLAHGVLAQVDMPIELRPLPYGLAYPVATPGLAPARAVQLTRLLGIVKSLAEIRHADFR